MSYEHLRPANFMRHIVRGNGNFQATDVHSVDQCALDNQLEGKRERRRMEMGAGNGPLLPSQPMRDFAERMRVYDRTVRRGQRGGSNLDQRDAPIDY